MKSYLSLILRYIKKDNKGYIYAFVSTFLAIILILISYGLGITRNYEITTELNNNYGDYCGYFNSVSKEKANIIINHNMVDNVGISKYDGVIELEDNLNDGKVGIYACNEYLLKDIFNIKLSDGRFPSKEGECIISRRVIEVMNPSLKLGDKISYYNEFDKKVQVSIVGIIEDVTPIQKEYERFNHNEGIVDNIITYMSDSNYVKEESNNYRIYIKNQDDLDVEVLVTLLRSKLYNETTISDYDDYINREGFKLLDEYYTSSYNLVMFWGNTVVISIAISIVAYIISISGFIISYNLKLQDINFLMKVGAHNRQITALVILETFIISILGGLTAVIFGVLALFTKYRIKELIGEYILIGIVVTTIITIVSIIATYKAIKSDIHTLEESFSIDEAVIIKGSRSKYIEWELAKRYSMRSSAINKYSITTTTITFIVIIMFINQLCIYTTSNKYYANLEWDIMYSRDFSDIHESEIDIISNIDGIQSVYNTHEVSTVIPVKEVKAVSQLAISDKSQPLNISNSNEKYKFIDGIIKVIDDKEFRLYNNDSMHGSINLEGFRKGGVILEVASFSGQDYLTTMMPEYCKFTIGEKLYIPKVDEFYNSSMTSSDKVNALLSDNSKLEELEIMGLVSYDPLRKISENYQPDFKIIVHKDYFDKIIEIKGNNDLFINARNDTLNESTDKLEDIAKKKGDKIIAQNSIREKNIEAQYKDTSLFVGISLLVLIVVVANTINITRTNIIVRKKEYQLFRAIGMEYAQIRRVILFENIILMFKSCIVGVVAGALIAIITRLQMESGTEGYMSIWLFIILSTIVFIFSISIVGVLLNLKKFRKNEFN